MDPESGVDQKDLALLIRDKYEGAKSMVTDEDLERLASGEPLAYIIGTQPFLGLTLRLDSHPLIPRPETEWWTEVLIRHLKERFGDAPFHLLDLCAGSGAIGIAVLAKLPNARVSFAELSPLHSALIALNIDENAIDESRADIRSGDLFGPFPDTKFDVIATNPPYIPETRVLDASVSNFEPHEALFAGDDGLDFVRVIAHEAKAHLFPGGEVWIECDESNAHTAETLLVDTGAVRALMRSDLYGRPRLVVGYYA